jgi:hypothetical protein
MVSRLLTPRRSAMLRSRLLMGWLWSLLKRPGVRVPPPAPARMIGRLVWVWRLPSALPQP